MKDKDYGIILSKTDYSESSYILKVYSSKKGLSSFLFRGAKKKKGQANIYPLSIVEFEYGINPKSDLHYLNNLNTYVNISNCFFDPVKSSILFFLNEILQKTLKQSEPDLDLLTFFISRLKYLDIDDYPMNFHLHFLVDYSKFQGIHPGLPNQQEPICFDLQGAEFLAYFPNHELVIKGDELKVFIGLLKHDYDSKSPFDYRGHKRSRILELLLQYYSIQLDGFGKCKTLDVLETIFHN